MSVDDKDRYGIEDEVEKWLDDGIAQFAKAEPRVGLERRVLARVAEARQVAQEGDGRRLRWGGVLAFGTAAALLPLAFVLLGRIDRRTIPQAPFAKVEAPRQTSDPDASRMGQVTASSKVPSPKLGSPKLASGELNRGERGIGEQDNPAPKLGQFPSASPLSDQERMLAQYVNHFPEKAALMARAQTELGKQDEREMAAPWPADVSGSQPQE
jgi:hypothetical protein